MVSINQTHLETLPVQYGIHQPDSPRNPTSPVWYPSTRLTCFHRKPYQSSMVSINQTHMLSQETLPVQYGIHQPDSQLETLPVQYGIHQPDSQLETLPVQYGIHQPDSHAFTASLTT
ncbi:hypothetical protein DPMN_119460 [Dreissena polymorpha]|uniref:Uncharacterized protein n=1 Tax=Dreissena polymorpha TaxID=45954 RepID=A0A9D4GLZ9_DREPO|nr:hypothetical protein DPMN_119460 [Dreissena polymorpha]